MKIIDRYLLLQFLKTFMICFSSLAGLYIVFDAFTNIEEFLRAAERFGGLHRLLGGYYGYRTILFFDRTNALLTLVAAMFTVTWIQRHNELIALMAAGISRIRVIRPILILAVILSLTAAVNREVVLPRIANELSLMPKDLSGDQAQQMRPRYDNQTDVFIEGRTTYRNEMKIESPKFRLPPALDEYGTHLQAAWAYYKAPVEGRPGGYLLDGLVEPKGLESKPSLNSAGQPVVITPHDAPTWLRPGQCFVVSEVNFEQLTGDMAFRQFASTWQLIQALHNRSLNFGADVRVAVHTRLVQPVLDVTLLFLGLPLVVARTSRNIFKAIGMCLGVVGTFMTVSMSLQYLGANSLVSPAFAAWLPVLIFVPCAVGTAEAMWE